MRFIYVFLIVCLLCACDVTPPKKPGEAGYQRPNILIVLTDDQSWAHTSYAKYPFVNTPNFDKLAKQGIYFNKTYAAAPSCTASRSAILTGQYPWRLKSAAVLGGEWPAEFETYPQILQNHGYHVGHTGKGWGPGKITDPSKMPDVKSYFFQAKKKYFWQLSPPHPQATSLAHFLHHKPKEKPFAFWVGIREPHRPFEQGDVSRFKSAKNASEFLPGFLPDNELVRQDLAAYLTQIERFDKILGQIIAQLKDYDVFNNTLIVVTSDNGMSFGRAKTQNYQYGVRVPLVIYWKGVTHQIDNLSDLINLIDLAPTFLEAAEIPIPAQMTGKSLLPLLFNDQTENLLDRSSTLTMTERHSYHARPNHLGYPTRALYTHEYSLIKNYFPERWPSGDRNEEAEVWLLWDHDKQQPIEPYHSLATAKRPSMELYDLQADPAQINNLANMEEHKALLGKLEKQMDALLLQAEDPLTQTGRDHFSGYPWAMLENNGLE